MGKSLEVADTLTLGADLPEKFRIEIAFHRQTANPYQP